MTDIKRDSECKAFSGKRRPKAPLSKLEVMRITRQRMCFHIING